MMSAYELGEVTLAEALNTRRQAHDAALLAESAQVDIHGLIREPAN